MIIDALENSIQYLALNPRFEKAFNFLSNPAIGTLPDGRHDIDGDEVYAIVFRGKGRDWEDARMEAHEKYIDIQMVLFGMDKMGWKARGECETKAADQDKPDEDVYFYKDGPQCWFDVLPGNFVIFFPLDAHLPTTGKGHMHKIIIKVKA
jgi:YhcH/YjgK/YiaL family protein